MSYQGLLTEASVLSGYAHLVKLIDAIWEYLSRASSSHKYQGAVVNL